MNPGGITPVLFLNLAEAIAYRLSARQADPRQILNVILDGKDFGGASDPSFDAECRKILLQTLRVILVGYGETRRKMGPLAVIHPIRVASIYCRVSNRPSMIGLMNCLLHDMDEDLTTKTMAADQYAAMQKEYRILRDLLTQSQVKMLDESLSLLTHDDAHTYNEYLAEIMGHAGARPDVIEAKLADRTDNTLDIGVSLPGIRGQGAFGAIFDLMFLPNYPGLKAPADYVPMTEAEKTQTLANLFKNAEFVNLLRTESCELRDTSAHLRDELITSSLRIARFLMQDAFTTIPPGQQLRAAEAVQHYCQHGGLEAVYEPATDLSDPFDGLFLGDKHERKNKIRGIIQDNEQLARVAVLFLAVFASFRSDPTYQIKGIDRAGVRPVREKV